MKKRTLRDFIASEHAARLIRFLARKKKSLSPLLILTHDYPDPDALASSVALQFIAERRYGIQSQIVYGGVIGRMENRAMVSILKLPVRKLKAGDFRKYDRVALIDTQPLFENNSFPENKTAAIVIDQHPYVKKPAADLAIVDTECGATCVILAQALFRLRMEIPARIATALAYGIISDTLNLYRARRPEVLQTYLELLPNCDLKALARIQNPPRSRRFFVTLGRGIRHAMASRGLIVSHLGFVENPDLISQTADFLLNYGKTHWSLCTGRYNGKLHVSFRTSTSNAVAAEILRDAFKNRSEAGGHSTIAGGSFYVGKAANEKTWKKNEQALVSRLKKRLRVPSKIEFYYPFRQRQ